MFRLMMFFYETEKSFNLEHARKILDFVLQYHEYPIVINCEAGYSRSPAVAKFVLDYIKQENSEHIVYPTYSPNPLVYDTLVKLYTSSF